MPGSGQVEQVTVRFQADINQYIQAIAQVTKAIQGFATGAEGSTAKAMAASVKVAQAYSKVAQESGKVAVEQAKVAAAADKAAMAHDRLASSSNKSGTSMTNMGSALRGAIGQYLSLGIAISQVANVVKEGMDFNKFMEVSTTAFGVMMKSVDGAKAKMKELFDYAVNSPLTFKDTVSASRQLMAYGFTASELIPTINTLGIVAKATGVQLGDMAYVYGTLRSQGRAYTRDLMQFAMRGIPIYEELAKVVGKPVKELQKMTEEGKIGFAEVEKAFQNMTTGTGTFAGFFDEYMKTYEGKMSMLTDVYQQATGKLTAGMFEALKPAIDELTIALKENGNAFASWGKVIGDVVTGTISGLKSTGDVFKMFGDALIWLVKPLGLVLDLFNVFGAFKWDTIIIAIGAIVTVINPVVGAVILLSEAIVLASKAYNAFINSVDYKKVYAGDFKREEMRSKGVLTQNSTTLAVVPVLDQAAAEEVSKELEKMLDLLRKYQDEWAMIQAKNLVASEKDIYAVANLENELRIREIKDKLKGYDSILTKALAIQDLIHKDAIEKIRKETQERLTSASMSNASSASQPYYTAQYQINMSQKYGVPFGDISTAISQMKEYETASIKVAGIITKLKSAISAKMNEELAKISERESAREQNEVEMQQNALDYANALKGDALMMEDLARWQKILNFYKEKGLDIEKEITDQIAIQKFNMISTGRNPAFWNANKIATITAFSKGQNLQGMAGLAYGTLQNTGIGNIMEGYAGRRDTPLGDTGKGMGTGINMFLTAISAAAGPMKLLLDFIIQIVSSSKPMMDLIEEVTYSVSQALMPVIETLANTLRWLYDSVIVPIGNAIIDIVNGIIGLLNTIPFVHINYLNHLKTTTQALEEMAKAAEENARVTRGMDALGQTISFLTKRLNDAIDSQIQSYKDLYEVGAMSATEYATKSSAAEASRPENLKNMVTIADQSLSTSTAILARLTALNAIQTNINNNDLTAAEKLNMLTNAGLATTLQPVLANPPKVTIGDTNVAAPIVNVENNTTVTVTQINALLAQIATMGTDIATLQAQVAAMAVPPTSVTTTTVNHSNMLGGFQGLAVGTPNVPYDMPANIHKGEGIIPATFMDSIRKGDLSLSGGGNGGGNVNVVVNVKGSVTSENDLAATIAKNIFIQRKRGLVTI